MFKQNNFNIFPYKMFRQSIKEGDLCNLEYLNEAHPGIYAYADGEFLNLAIEYGHFDIVKYIVEYDQMNPNENLIISLNNNQALRLAAKHGRGDIIEYFIDLKFKNKVKYGSISVHDNNDEAIRLAKENGHLQVVEKLQYYGLGESMPRGLN